MNTSRIIINGNQPGVSIKFNTIPGASISMNANSISMLGVEQNSTGGTIKHNASEQLNQVGNTMNANNGGEITNESEGQLNQLRNDMSAENGGKIKNIVKKTSEMDYYNHINRFYNNNFDIYFLINS
jgi:hypothetical protein